MKKNLLSELITELTALKEKSDSKRSPSTKVIFRTVAGVVKSHQITSEELMDAMALRAMTGQDSFTRQEAQLLRDLKAREEAETK